MDKQTSDERLLKIIEGAGESRRNQASVPGFKQPFGRPVNIKFNLASLKNIIQNTKFSLSKVNMALIGLGVLLTLIFIYTLFSGPVISKSNAAYFTPADSAAVVKFISSGQAEGLMRKNFGKEKIKRNFFLPANFKEGLASTEESSNTVEDLKDFKLVGIIWSRTPEVMIENSKDSRTYTLKQGDSFNDQFKVKAISRNSATLEVNLSSGIREYELR